MAIEVSVMGAVLCCKLNELETRLLEIESKSHFYKWTVPPLEQLDYIIGCMAEPGMDQMPVAAVYYLSTMDNHFSSQPKLTQEQRGHP